MDLTGRRVVVTGGAFPRGIEADDRLVQVGAIASARDPVMRRHIS